MKKVIMNRVIYMPILIVAFLFIYIDLGFAANITPSFSTSFTGCSADQQTPTDAWACGTNSTVFSTVNAGSCTSRGYQGIYTAANNPSGSGGRGWRRWVCGGTLYGGTGYVRIGLNTTVPELWLRFYTRFEAGFEWNSGTGMQWAKFVYIYGGSGSSVLDITRASWTMTTQSGGGPDTSPSNTETGTCSNCGWNAINPSGAMQPNGARLGDNSWHSIELHIKDQSGSGTYDGVWDIWIDGILVEHHTTLNWSSGAPQGFNNFSIMINQSTPSNPGPMYNDIDDIAISTTGYIGSFGAVKPNSPTLTIY